MNTAKEHINQDPNQWVDGPIPEQYWMPNMYGERIITPTNSLGVVDIDALTERVALFIRPDFPWPPGEDLHHAHHIHRRYAELQEQTNGEIPALDFCELPTNKVWYVRLFHTLVHGVTIEPPMPDPEVMRGMVNAWRAASGLYQTIRGAVRQLRGVEDYKDLPEFAPTFEEEAIGRSVAYAINDKHFDDIGGWLDALYDVPKIYWPFDANLPYMDGLEQIGDVMRYHHHRRIRAIRQPSGLRERILARQQGAVDDSSCSKAAA